MALTCRDRAYVSVLPDLDCRPLLDHTCGTGLAVAVSCMLPCYVTWMAALHMNVIHLSMPCILIPAFSAGVMSPIPEWERKKVMMYDHQMYKGRILALEPPGSLDVVLELAVQSLVQVAVIIELFLQVNVPDMGKPKALSEPERLCGSRAKHLQSVSYQYPGGYSCTGPCRCKHLIGIKVHLCVRYAIGKYGSAKAVHHCKAIVSGP